MTSRLDNFLISLQTKIRNWSGFDIRYPVSDYTRGYMQAINDIENQLEQDFKIKIPDRFMILAKRGEW